MLVTSWVYRSGLGMILAAVSVAIAAPAPQTPNIVGACVRVIRLSLDGEDSPAWSMVISGVMCVMPKIIDFGGPAGAAAMVVMIQLPWRNLVERARTVRHQLLRRGQYSIRRCCRQKLGPIMATWSIGKAHSHIRQVGQDARHKTS